MTIFKVNDKVRIKSVLKKNLTGVIAEVKTEVWSNLPVGYLVKFDDSDLIPSQMEYTAWELELISAASSWQDQRCTCGLKFVREGGKHSDWCDLYTKED